MTLLGIIIKDATAPRLTYFTYNCFYRDIAAMLLISFQVLFSLPVTLYFNPCII